MLSEVLVHGHLDLLFLGHGEAEHHGGKHMVELSSSPHGRQEIETMIVLVDFLLLPSFIPFRPLAYWMIPPTFKESLSPFANLWKHPQKHTRSVLC
jgi:hypothetical protein